MDDFPFFRSERALLDVQVVKLVLGEEVDLLSFVVDPLVAADALDSLLVLLGH